MRWKDLRRVVGGKWVPGAHVPFDPVASRLAHQWKQSLVVMRGNDLKNLQHFLTGKSFRGTKVS